MPTPVHELPSYKARELSKSQSGKYEWLPYLILGGVIVIVVGMSIRKAQAQSFQLKSDEIDDE